jgi:succinyl-diaminopimelate desuccinylase
VNARDIEQKVDMTYIQNVLMELIKIESINPPKDGGEKKAAEFLAGRLQELAIDAEVHEVADGRAHAVGIISGSNTGPTLVLNGHLDVVGANPEDWDNPPFDPVIRNRRIYGRGAADMKGGIASMRM